METEEAPACQRTDWPFLKSPIVKSAWVAVIQVSGMPAQISQDSSLGLWISMWVLTAMYSISVCQLIITSRHIISCSKGQGLTSVCPTVSQPEHLIAHFPAMLDFGIVR